MTADTLGGVFSYSVTLGAFLRCRGARVTLATLGRKLGGAERRRLASFGIDLEESDYRLEWMDDPWDDVQRSGEWLLSLERRHRPDVVHVNGYAHAALPWIAPAISVAHSCVLSWWRAVFGEQAPSRYDRYRREVLSGLAAARAVVAPTQALLRMLEREYGAIPTGRVIHNGAAPAALRLAGHTANENTVAKEPLILCAGRVWDRAKNVRLLARVAGDLPWRCYVAGDPRGPDGQLPDELDALVPLGLLSPDELLGWMRRASIFASPALYEPFGLSILEAALAGCALVLADIPSLRELWDGAAEFADPRDAGAWGRVLRDIIEDAERRSVLSMRATERAREYGIEVAGTRYLELYDLQFHQRPKAPRLEAHP